MLSFLNLYGLYSRHLEILSLPFQPVIENAQTLENLRNRKYRYHNLFPLSITLLVFADSVNQYRRFGNDPQAEFFNRVTAPQMPDYFQVALDVAFGTLLCLTSLCNLSLIFDRFPHLDCIYLLNEDSHASLSLPYRKWFTKVPEKELQQKLLVYYKRSKMRVKILVTALRLNCDLTSSAPVVLVQFSRMWASNWQYKPSLRMYFVAIICPFFFRVFVSSLEIGFRFIVQNGFLHIRQTHYILKLKINQKWIKNERYVTGVYYKFGKLMRETFELTQDINKFNKLYEKYITFIIVLMAVGASAILNACRRGYGQTTIDNIIPWLAFSLLHSTHIFRCCSASFKTVVLNMKLFRKLRQHQITLLSARCLNECQIVRLDLVNEYKTLFQKTNFRFCNSTLNNKLFAFQIVGFVSAVYLKLIEDDIYDYY